MMHLIMGHCGAKGTIDTDAMTMTLLQYRNTPIQNSGGKSLAQLALGRALKSN